MNKNKTIMNNRSKKEKNEEKFILLNEKRENIFQKKVNQIIKINKY